MQLPQLPNEIWLMIQEFKEDQELRDHKAKMEPVFEQLWHRKLHVTYPAIYGVDMEARKRGGVNGYLLGDRCGLSPDDPILDETWQWLMAENDRVGALSGPDRYFSDEESNPFTNSNNAAPRDYHASNAARRSKPLRFPRHDQHQPKGSNGRRTRRHR